jgi:zinc transport system ATP-binding protein
MAVASSQEYKALFGARDSSALAIYKHHHNHKHLPEGIDNLKDRVFDYDSPHSGGDLTHNLNLSIEYNGADS